MKSVKNHSKEILNLKLEGSIAGRNSHHLVGTLGKNTKIRKYKNTKIRKNTKKYEQIRTNTNKYEQIRTNTNKYEKIRKIRRI